ncbi:MAG TPA: hypothetical protein VJX67_21855 [Blastocatellia bacterium]|nr:hypothetical protein [Blastocatellia bacterium]
MVKFALIVIVIPVIVIAVLACMMIYLVKSSDRARKVPGIQDKSALVSTMGVCSKCGQTRILVKEEGSFCAFCYSSLRTKA